MATILILNGPNLNLLGQREPEVYGHDTLADVEDLCRKKCEALGHEAAFFQSNAEHELIDRIHTARQDAAAIVINPGALSHTSIALRDALSAFDGPIGEIHISNIHAREEFRHFSYISAIAGAVICGAGIAGYGFAIESVAAKI
ncbi:type II 3-dehydroquinate dehydratase [Croceicoccus naphthovorans]|uniref:3-dehydroquinate dehydratase n=1 Tax=Croceicoccus naphthovorans TaxID=1348774 RepID=A0A0G3XFE1_9SPHN|nr:type II 3-dehydroquinate dehydratase [Croceicoccus naphthovorans]AKM09334.1 3-dehydroquinate dehydratase [Croceicoccus naphthovorans]MBB3990245.1 3-dehydroquinate dehydratase-2 [Croceicoccus naphthovorans]